MLFKLRKIPLYPYAERNTTYLSYLQQGRFVHYEVNRETGMLESIEFVKKPARVVWGPLQNEDDEDDGEVGEVGEECAGERVKDLRQRQMKKLSKKKRKQSKVADMGAGVDALAQRVIGLVFDSLGEEEAEARNVDEGQDNRHGTCLQEGSRVESNNSNSVSYSNSAKLRRRGGRSRVCGPPWV